MTKHNITIFFSSILLIGCATIQPDAISLDCSSLQNDLRENDFWKDINARMIEVETEQPIQHIEDFSCLDSTMFVLTNDNRLISVNLNTGKKIKEIHRIGHARNEMARPLCIDADGQFLYVFDSGKRQFQVLDKDMNFIKNIPAKGVFRNFIKCKEGFMCSMSVDGTNVLLLDNNGEQKYAKRISSVKGGSMNLMSGAKTFVKDIAGNIYAKGNYSDSIYIWDGKELILKYDIELGKRYADKTSTELDKIDNSATLSYCVLRNNLVFSTMMNRVIRWHLYDLKKNNHFVGVPARINGTPFGPKYQNGKILADVLMREQIRNDKKEKVDEPNKFVILLYEYVGK